jgi:hypothetical protein
MLCTTRQQTGTSTLLEASFGVDSKKNDFKGALLYRLQRKYATRTGNYHNNSAAFIESIAANIYLLVIWDVEDGMVWDVEDGLSDFHVYLLECADKFTWDEDKLWALYKEYGYRFLMGYCHNLSTWLMHDGTVMKTRLDVAYGSDYKLSIFISEETRKYNMLKPIKINPKRLVLPPSMLIVLIYAVRLRIKSSFKLNIRNQCWNVGLVSPIYVTDVMLECYRPPKYEVYAGDTMKSGFMINNLNDESYGVLMYKLQRRQLHESTEISEDTSNVAHLLVVWEISEFSKELYADVLLVECDETFTWDEDELKKLYCENHDRLKEYNGVISNTWFMENSMTLKTTFSARVLKGSPELNISISEGRDDYVRPLCIDTER